MLQKMLRTLFSILFCYCFVAPLSAQIVEDMPGLFRDLTRLEGVWFEPSDRGDRLEIWTFVNDSTMTGRGIRIKAETGDTILLETLRLELRDTAIRYYARVRGQNKGEFVAFRLTEAGADEYLFENPAHDDPKKIRYVLLARREIQVTTEGIRNGRPVKQEFVFEREFNAASTEFRLRAGLNANNLYKINELGTTPKFSPRPGWDLGFQMAFKGRGGFISVNLDLGIAGKFTHVQSKFDALVEPDSANPTGQITYERDLTYNQTWLSIGVFPEVKFKRDGRLSVIFGPYYSRLLINSVRGTELPLRNKKVFNYNNDFNKSDLGAMIGFNLRHNLGKKDIGGAFGIRAHIGMKNLDNLYIRCNDNGGACYYNGRMGLAGVSLYYSVDLLRL